MRGRHDAPRQYGFRDYVRVEGDSGSAIPAEKMVHIIRPSRSGAETGGLRTICGLGRGHRVWRITMLGARAEHVTADGWTICAACCQRSGAHRRDGSGA